MTLNLRRGGLQIVCNSAISTAALAFSVDQHVAHGSDLLAGSVTHGPAAAILVTVDQLEVLEFGRPFRGSFRRMPPPESKNGLLGLHNR